MEQTEQKIGVSHVFRLMAKVDKVYRETSVALACNFLEKGYDLTTIPAENVTNVTLVRPCNILAQMAHGMAISLVCHSAVPERGQIGQIGHENAISDMSDLGANETNETLFGCLIYVSHFAKKIGIFY